MTRVDFYLTQASSDKQRLLTTCRLAEKANRLGHHVFIYADKAEQVQQLDDLLWTFREGSFLPHTTSHATDVKEHSVVIGSQHQDDAAHDLMISLAENVPDCFSRFKRVAEIVAGSEEQKKSARQRFKFYRDRGYELETHELRE